MISLEERNPKKPDMQAVRNGNVLAATLNS